MFEKVMRFYHQGLYTKYQVAQFVVKGKLTVDQYKEITGEAFPI